jgi:hypothetical protein
MTRRYELVKVQLMCAVRMRSQESRKVRQEQEAWSPNDELEALTAQSGVAGAVTVQLNVHVPHRNQSLSWKFKLGGSQADFSFLQLTN